MSSKPAIRRVLPAEVEHFQRHGWTKLDSFINPDLVSLLLSHAKIQMGGNGDSNPINPDGDVGFFNYEWVDGHKKPALLPILHGIGTNASILMARSKPVGARYFSDLFAPKLPANLVGKHVGNKETPPHQDLMTWSLDRTGGMTFWIPLSDSEARDGTMEFFNGSHKLGPLCGYTSQGGTVLDVYPELPQRNPSSGQISYKVGDATVHSDLCIHRAGLNLSSQPRWAYILACVPADACWTGAPTRIFPTAGMTQFAQLDDERFPIIGGC